MKYYTVEGNKKSIFRVFAIYYICMALFCVVRISGSFNLFPNGIAGDILYSVIIQIGVIFLLPFVLYMVLLKVKPKQVFEHCNFSRINVTVILISIGLGFLCFVINVAVSSLFNGILAFSGYNFGGGTVVSDNYYSTGNFFLQLFLVAVLPGFCEEFLHRGIVLQGTKHMGFKKSILISSILFALMHYNVEQVFYAFVIGLILGFVSVVAKNIYPVIIIHFINNGIATYIDFAKNRGWIFGDILDRLQEFLISNNPVFVFFVISIVMIVVVVLLCLLIWLLYKQTIVRKVNKAVNKAYAKVSVFNHNKPIRVGEEQEAILEMLESSTLLNLDYKSMDNPIDVVMPKEKSRYKPTLKDRVFLWGAIALGALVTIFTYVWGMI